MDVHTTEQRSKNMAAIKATGTKPEIFLAKKLWALGYRYRKNNKTVFGKPDFTFKKYKIAIFIDSEFFHGKNFYTKKKPATNTEFWERKILGNIERDRKVNEFLINDGWVVLRFWAKDVYNRTMEILSEIETCFKDKLS
ncbi:very short patch repair endonuclease [Flavobacterium rhizosphaerae]|uniref:Very short patch repair endonuclease n=1 Tax=Flavobacterium rhizosphaerae TaxID=3163298 RepID=A0ABW8YXI6_9FLAO